MSGNNGIIDLTVNDVEVEVVKDCDYCGKKCGHITGDCEFVKNVLQKNSQSAELALYMFHSSGCGY
jgi:hypothetical protein